MDIDGNPAAIVGHTQAAVGLDFHVDIVAKPRERFIDAIVN
jgi:hypothetical protein